MATETLTLATSIAALKTAVEAQAVNANAEELAYLATTIKEINGMSTLIDVIQAGQQALADIDETLDSNKAAINAETTAALDTLEASINSAVQQAQRNMAALEGVGNGYVTTTTNALNSAVTNATDSMDTASANAVATVEAKTAALATAADNLTPGVTPESVFMAHI